MVQPIQYIRRPDPSSILDQALSGYQAGLRIKAAREQNRLLEEDRQRKQAFRNDMLDLKDSFSPKKVTNMLLRYPEFGQRMSSVFGHLDQVNKKNLSMQMGRLKMLGSNPELQLKRIKEFATAYRERGDVATAGVFEELASGYDINDPQGNARDLGILETTLDQEGASKRASASYMQAQTEVMKSKILSPENKAGLVNAMSKYTEMVNANAPAQEKIDYLNDTYRQYGEPAKAFYSSNMRQIPTPGGGSTYYQDALNSVKFDQDYINATSSEKADIVEAKMKELAGKIASKKAEGRETAKIEVEETAPLKEKSQNTFNLNTMQGVPYWTRPNQLDYYDPRTGKGDYITVSKGDADASRELAQNSKGLQQAILLARKAYKGETAPELIGDEIKSLFSDVPILKQLVPSDVKSYEDAVNNLVVPYARSIGHSGVLTEKDLDKTFKAFIRGGDTKESRELKLLFMQDLIENGQRDYLLRTQDPKAAQKGYEKRIKDMLSIYDGIKKGGKFKEDYDAMVNSGASLQELRATLLAPPGAKIDLNKYKDVSDDDLKARMKALTNEVNILSQ